MSICQSMLSFTVKCNHLMNLYSFAVIYDLSSLVFVRCISPYCNRTVEAILCVQQIVPCALGHLVYNAFIF